ncbi:hypothetical protein [Pseudomonas aeruginosa]|uniref:phage tail tube protein n=1 Tax=Pseudomonas aeruginosa TaxID=287 RepID=UPI003AAF0B6D
MALDSGCLGHERPLAVEKVEHKESYSGQKALVRSFPIGKTATVNITLHSIGPDNLALTLYGKVVAKAAGSVTGEVLPADLVAGDVIRLANFGVSELVITDSAEQPGALDPQYYALRADGAYGEVQLLGLPTPAPTQPFKAAYEYAATKQVGMFTAPQPTVALRYKGINLAEGGAPVIVELYKVATDPLQELALVQRRQHRCRDADQRRYPAGHQQAGYRRPRCSVALSSWGKSWPGRSQLTLAASRPTRRPTTASACCSLTVN